MWYIITNKTSGTREQYIRRHQRCVYEELSVVLIHPTHETFLLPYQTDRRESEWQNNKRTYISLLIGYSLLASPYFGQLKLVNYKLQCGESKYFISNMKGDM